MNKLTLVIFTGSILLMCLAFTPVVFDGTLFARLVVLSFFITIGFCYYFFKKKQITIDIISLPYFLFVCFIALSSFWSLNNTLSYFEAIKAIAFFLVFLFFQNWSYKNNLNYLIAGGVLAFIGSLIFLGNQLWNIPSYCYENIYKITAVSGHKNLYSSFVFLAMIISIYGVIVFKGKYQKAFFFIIALQFIIICFLRSRAVWFGSVITILSYIIMSLFRFKPVKQNWVWMILVLMTVTLFFYVLLPLGINRYLERAIDSESIESIKNISSLKERFLVWEKTYELIQDNFWVGVGAGNWKITYTQYGFPSIYRVQDLNIIFQRPHNEFLRIISEYGIVGFLLFFWTLITFVKLVLDSSTLGIKKEVRVLCAGLIGYLGICFFSFPVERVEHNILIIIILNLLIYQCHRKNTRSFLKISSIILVFISLSCGYIIYQQLRSAFYHKDMLEARATNNHKKVIELCDQATSYWAVLDDVSIPYSWYRGNANASLRRFRDMEEDFKKSRKYNPFNPNVLNDLGSAYVTNGKINDAIEAYKEAIRINPRFDDPKLNLVVTYLNLEDYKSAQLWNESILHDSERREVYRQVIEEKLSGK